MKKIIQISILLLIFLILISLVGIPTLRTLLKRDSFPKNLSLNSINYQTSPAIVKFPEGAKSFKAFDQNLTNLKQRVLVAKMLKKYTGKILKTSPSAKIYVLKKIPSTGKFKIFNKYSKIRLTQEAKVYGIVNPEARAELLYNFNHPDYFQIENIKSIADQKFIEKKDQDIEIKFGSEFSANSINPNLGIESVIIVFFDKDGLPIKNAIEVPLTPVNAENGDISNTEIETGFLDNAEDLPEDPAIYTKNSSNTHLACNGNLCEAVQGAGTDQCADNSNCRRHNECDAEGFCKVIRTPGLDQCSGPEDCSHHKDCNSDGICARVSGEGDDTCTSDSECGHKECNSNGICKQVSGSGSDTCTSDTDCKHKECDPDGYCVQKDEAGEDECTIDTDCEHQYKSCDVNTCETFNGPGVDNCSTDDDCSHLECHDQTCMPTPGKGQDSCETSMDCIYKACNESGYCEYTAGTEEDECTSNSECGHKECNSNGTCKQVSGSGTDTCSSSDDCSHRICEGIYCTLESGEGEDECAQSTDCTYAACNSGYCTQVAGKESDQCTSDSECGHKECDGEYCHQTEGEGEDTCEDHSDCLEEDPSPDPSPSPTRRPPHPFYGISYDEPITIPDSIRASVDIIKLTKKSIYAKGSSLGDPEAVIKVEVFHDLKCGMCKYWFFDTLPTLTKEYVEKGLVEFKFLDYPLIMREPEITLANATLCAGDQSKYLEYANKLYSDMKNSNQSKIYDYAEVLGLDLQDFRTCVESKVKIKQIKDNVEKGEIAGINGTPMFLINGQLVKGAKPVKEFQDLFDQILAKSDA